MPHKFSPLAPNRFQIGFMAIVAIFAWAQTTLTSAGEELPKSAQPVDELSLPNVEIQKDENRLYFVLPARDELPENIQFPRLANVVLGIRWLGEEKASMQVKSEPAEWSIDLSKKPDNCPRIVVLDLDAPVVVSNSSVRGHADRETHIVQLPAKYAKTHGSKLRFEPQPHKNTVGYWTDESDTAEWAFDFDQPGTYEVDILQGCGKGHGGSAVELQVGEHKLSFNVEETGHFQNFIWRTVGQVELKADQVGKHQTVKLTPQKKQGGAVMDVRAIRLCPKGITRSFDAELADPNALPKTR